ncbi:hypothetical protein BDL97_13G121100 [Sphagnum fallax]|nr:hypothetical protein BDL97_13G121100 [Sphagnum fallax]
MRYVIDCNSTEGCNTNTWVFGLTLNDASIAGTLPSGISNLTFLSTLTLTGNPNLMGPLPVELGSLPLNILDLHNNGFNGSIPTELELSNLIQLDLSGNQFIGDFPTQFLNARTLVLFKIASNQLQGTIQSNAFENLTSLSTLDLSDNKFTGSFPNVTFLYNLNYLNLSYNKLQKNYHNFQRFSATSFPQVLQSWIFQA